MTKIWGHLQQNRLRYGSRLLPIISLVYLLSYLIGKYYLHLPDLDAYMEAHVHASHFRCIPLAYFLGCIPLPCLSAGLFPLAIVYRLIFFQALILLTACWPRNHLCNFFLRAAFGIEFLRSVCCFVFNLGVLLLGMIVNNESTAMVTESLQMTAALLGCALITAMLFFILKDLFKDRMKEWPLVLLAAILLLIAVYAYP